MKEGGWEKASHVSRPRAPDPDPDPDPAKLLPQVQSFAVVGAVAGRRRGAGWHAQARSGVSKAKAEQGGLGVSRARMDAGGPQSEHLGEVT